MTITEQYLKGISDGDINQIIENETLDKDKLYIVKDFPSNSGITNDQMQEILNNVLIRAFVNKNEVFVCADDGTYIKGNLYKFTGDSWEDITKTSAETDSTGTNIAQKFSQIDSSLDDLINGLNTVQSDIVEAERDISNIEQDISILETTTSVLINNGDGTKYLSDDGTYKEIKAEVDNVTITRNDSEQLQAVGLTTTENNITALEVLNALTITRI